MKSRIIFVAKMENVLQKAIVALVLLMVVGELMLVVMLLSLSLFLSFSSSLSLCSFFVFVFV